MSAILLPRIFISHSHHDLDFVQQLARDLRLELDNEETVWYDADNLKGGDVWWNTITEHIKWCTCFLLVVTPDSMESKWVRDEAIMAWRRKNNIHDDLLLIPLLVRPCNVWDDLGILQTVSFLDKPYLDALQTLKTTLAIDKYKSVLLDNNKIDDATQNSQRSRLEVMPGTDTPKNSSLTQFHPDSSAIDDTSRSLAIGTSLQLGRYIITKILGEGGMGTALLATDLRSGNKLVVIKELVSDNSDPAKFQEDVRNFKREVAMLASLDHPLIFYVTDIFEENSRYFMVQKYIEGENLEERMDRTNLPMYERDVLGVASEMLDILAYLACATDTTYRTR